MMNMNLKSKMSKTVSRQHVDVIYFMIQLCVLGMTIKNVLPICSYGALMQLRLFLDWCCNSQSKRIYIQEMVMAVAVMAVVQLVAEMPVMQTILLLSVTAPVAVWVVEYVMIPVAVRVGEYVMIPVAIPVVEYVVVVVAIPVVLSLYFKSPKLLKTTKT